MKNSDLGRNLRNILPAAKILDGELWREIYARDASYFNIPPQAIVRPTSAEEVARLLAFASKAGIGVTFRSGGTSLSGQTLGTGIICELRTAWRNYRVKDEGRSIWFEPGLTVNQVNALLRPHHSHIGPDPASSSAAMMGGVLSNNSSGMEAGVRYNSYHTLASLEFMLANGHRYNSALAADRARFQTDESELCRGLLDIRRQILSNPEILDKINRKYRIKNVTGYAMNSFVDFSDPMDIFIHAIIGSEGTLAWIVSGELLTRPLQSVYSSSMLYFGSVTEAAATAAFLGRTGALAVELMDYGSLRSSQGLKPDMPAGTTAMLIDYGSDTSGELAETLNTLTPKLKQLSGLIHIEPFTHTVAQRAALWKLRDGVFPCVAGIRQPGSTVILEDIVAPVESLDALVEGVQSLFKSHGYNGAIFGHARDGNMHPLVTDLLSDEKKTANFADFIDKFVDLTLSLDGSLKGEHGTGRAMAPFVEREWGPEIYVLMKRLKKLADPQGILNPGVIINSDPQAYIKPLKSLDLFGEELGYPAMDRCMECGYCEHVCPCRDITFTPRQRTQARRIIAAAREPDLKKKYRRQFLFEGNQSCCTDSTCRLACPLSLDTGREIDAIRRQDNGKLTDSVLAAGANHYGSVVKVLRGSLKMAKLVEKVTGPDPMKAVMAFTHDICHQLPHWNENYPTPAKIPWCEVEAPDFIYFPACVTRIFGASDQGKDDLVTVMLRIAAKAGFKVSVPKDFEGICCGQIWEHKGSGAGQKAMAEKAVDTFFRVSECGRIPIVCDTTSCTHTLLSLAEQNAAEHFLSLESQQQLSKLKFIDITSWLLEHVLSRVKVTGPKGSVCLHPTCASKLLHLDRAMIKIAEACANSVTVPGDTHCCGSAGDRGFINPQVAKSATAPERANIEGLSFDGYYSLARTCEISMTTTIGRPYESIAYLVDECTSAVPQDAVR